MSKKKSQSLNIRNSTSEFLIFTRQTGENGIEVRYEDGSIWLTQKLMAELFDTSTDNIGQHLKNIYADGELSEGATTENFSVVRAEGNREVRRHLKFYNLDAIIAVGYRTNSKRATQFRQWATGILSEFAIKGYVMDKKRLENGSFLGEDYFEHLLAEIREIRLSERRFYQKITDIYATSLDYNKDSAMTREFFAKVQNKMHYAVHGHTAPELITARANSNKPHMGLTSWEGGPEGKIVKTDVSIAKNYLTPEELDSLGRIVNVYLELAENRARRKIPMTMEDWSKRLDEYLKFDERAVLQHAGSVSTEVSKGYAESEFEKYRIIQDRLFESDFDKETRALEQQITGKTGPDDKLFAVGTGDLDVIERYAEAGDVDAQSKLGSIYLAGDETSRDHGRAEKWLTKAADQGCTVARYHLGVLYLEGGGDIKSDARKATACFLAAAKQEDIKTISAADIKAINEASGKARWKLYLMYGEDNYHGLSRSFRQEMSVRHPDLVEVATTGNQPGGWSDRHLKEAATDFSRQLKQIDARIRRGKASPDHIRTKTALARDLKVYMAEMRKRGLSLPETSTQQTKIRPGRESGLS